MYQIIRKQYLNDHTVLMEIKTPHVALNAQPGQFVLVMGHETSERIPLTIHAKTTKTISIVFKVVGAGTQDLAQCTTEIFAISGPHGQPFDFSPYDNILIVSGGLGAAIAYPVAYELAQSKNVTVVLGFQTKNDMILYRDFKKFAPTIPSTDDGSYGHHGNVLQPLKDILNSKPVDIVYTIGPLGMMEAVTAITKRYNVPTIASLNAIMIDGSGMCGCCRVTVGGERKFACLDGPDFNSFEVNYHELKTRQAHGCGGHCEKQKS